MYFEPVYASKFIAKSALLVDEEKEALIQSGIVPVNDAFMPLWLQRAKIRLLYGGRGGGKSEGVFDKAIKKALTNKYFKCYYGRKVYDTVRGSCFDTLVASLKKMKKEHLFSFSEADNSSMIVRCKANGNVFIPFGANRPDLLKSIKDPTDFICEEFNQFEFTDFIELYPTLRTTRGELEFVGMFNTKDVFPDHWIIKLFFPDMYNGPDRVTYDALEGVTVQKVFVNYYDNYFIDQQQYYSDLKLAAGGSKRLLDAIANGAWGAPDNDNPWLHAFDYDKHTAESIPFLPTLPVYVSFDFNNEPFEATVWQFSHHKGSPNSFVHCIKEFSGKYKLETMCAMIRQAFPSSIMYVTGDRSGQNEDIGRNQTLYQMIAASLGLSAKQLNLNTHNLEHADSWMFLNTMLFNYPNIKISRECTNLINQMQIAKSDVKAPKPYTLLKDRGLYKLDAFDSMRYFFQTYFHQFAKDTYLKIIKKKAA